VEKSDFSEDELILKKLSDCADVEAFSNLMIHAHEMGVSAAEFVQEEPKRTSRKTIRRLCLKNKKQSIRIRITSVLKALWELPAEDPQSAFVNSLYSMPNRPAQPHKNSLNGRS